MLDLHCGVLGLRDVGEGLRVALEQVEEARVPFRFGETGTPRVPTWWPPGQGRPTKRANVAGSSMR